MRKRNFRRYVGAVLVWLLGGSAAMANLVICVYCNKALYVAGDACQATNAAGETVRLPRICRLGDTGCASITGFSGPTFKIKKSAKPLHVLFPVELEDMCRIASRGNAPIRDEVLRVAMHFGERYHDCLLNVMKPDEVAEQEAKGIGTRVAFLGYDLSREEFFGTSYRFSLTNRTALEPVFEQDPAHTPGSVSFQGETKFLGALLSGEANLPTPPPAEFTQTVKDIYAGAPVSEERVTACLLEMFRLHNQYSAALGYAAETCQEPYSIFRINRQQCLRVH
jgi:hypothetical protein